MSKKQPRPEMAWIEARGEYRKRITIGGKSRDVYGKTKQAVRDKIRALQGQEDAGMVLDDKTTLTGYAKQWYPVKVAGLSYKSAYGYKNAINVHLSPFFRNMALKDIRPFHVQQLMAEKADFSSSAQKKILMTLKQILTSAHQNGLIVRNPCDGIKASGAPAKRKKPLSKGQQAELVGAVKGTRAELFVLLCLYAGLRREEALGLIWANVHLDALHPYLDVRHTVTFEGNRPIHSELLKTYAAYRSIPMPPPLYDALRAASKAKVGPLVIPAVTTNGPMSSIAFRRMWDIVLQALDMTPNTENEKQESTAPQSKRKSSLTPKKDRSLSFNVEPHLLRHTYITELCASGKLDIKKIQYLAGHEDVKMTLQVYTHVTQNTPEELGARIGQIFSNEKTSSQNGSDKTIPSGVISGSIG